MPQTYKKDNLHKTISPTNTNSIRTKEQEELI
jgi:hypothetical protein